MAGSQGTTVRKDANPTVDHLAGTPEEVRAVEGLLANQGNGRRDANPTVDPLAGTPEEVRAAEGQLAAEGTGGGGGCVEGRDIGQAVRRVPSIQVGPSPS